MGFPIDLDEMDEVVFVREMEDRRKLREIGSCDYCRRPSSDRPCKEKDRHLNVKQQNHNHEVNLVTMLLSLATPDPASILNPGLVISDNGSNTTLSVKRLLNGSFTVHETTLFGPPLVQNFEKAEGAAVFFVTCRQQRLREKKT